MNEGMTLKQKVELAKKEYGFNKGVKWVMFLRITYPLGLLSVLGLPGTYLQYTQNLPPIMTVYWLAMICVVIMFGYGIYTFYRLGYQFVMCYWIASTLLSIIYTQSFYYSYIGTFYIDVYTGTIMLCQVVYALANIIYFHNRKILFFDDIVSPEVKQTDVYPNANVVAFSDYTKHANERIEYNEPEVQFVQNSEPSSQASPVTNSTPQSQNAIQNSAADFSAAESKGNDYVAWFIILGVFISILLGAVIYLYSELTTTQKELATTNEELMEYYNDNRMLRREIRLLKEELEGVEPQTDNTQVVIYNNQYHRPDCSVVADLYGVAMFQYADIVDAIYNGYSRCATCNP